MRLFVEIWLRRIVLSSVLVVVDATAVEIYKSDDSKLDFNTKIVTAFFQSNSYFGNSEEFLGGNTDSWGEFGIELGLAWEKTYGRSTMFAELSGVYTATGSNDASGLTIGLDKTSQLSLEQAHLGWRYDDPFNGLEEDTFTLTVGRQDFFIGSGMLIADGHSDGGERGGWYIGMRKSFQESVVAKLESKTLQADAFYLQNTPRRGGVQGSVVGGNIGYTFDESLSAGMTYMVVNPKLPSTDNLDIWSWRLGWNGFGGLELNSEYIIENSDQTDADGWYAQAAWSFSDALWSPWISYRYAVFSGDAPDTSMNESFSPIAYGFSDYGAWFQGEISGSYPLTNSNLGSDQFRIKVLPNESLTLNLLYYKFTLEVPSSLAPDVSSDDWGDEINLIVDYTLTDEWYLSGVLAVLFPGAAAEQWTGGSENWSSAMIYVSYTF